MSRKNKKTAAGAILMYLFLTGGSWMFINAYANSFNRLSEEKLIPASLTLSGTRANVQVLDRSLDLDLSTFRPDNKLYCAAYLAAPDEIRSAAYLIAIAYRDKADIIVKAVEFS